MKIFAELHNATATPLAAIPRSDIEALRDALVLAVNDGRAPCRPFRHRRQGDGGPVEVVAVLAADADGLLEVGRATLVGDSYPGLTPLCSQAHWFERELAEHYGVVPEGHPWLKPIRFHRSWRAGHDAWGRDTSTIPLVGVTDFFRVEGEEVHEVAVGPRLSAPRHRGGALRRPAQAHALPDGDRRRRHDRRARRRLLPDARGARRNHAVVARFEHTGRVDRGTSETIGLVGRPRAPAASSATFAVTSRTASTSTCRCR
jgi:hypothetical protein